MYKFSAVDSWSATRPPDSILPWETSGHSVPVCFECGLPLICFYPTLDWECSWSLHLISDWKLGADSGIHRFFPESPAVPSAYPAWEHILWQWFTLRLPREHPSPKISPHRQKPGKGLWNLPVCRKEWRPPWSWGNRPPHSPAQSTLDPTELCDSWMR